jgi:hypothetical protein
MKNREILEKFAREFIGDVKNAIPDHFSGRKFFRCASMKKFEFIDFEIVRRLNQELGVEMDRIREMCANLSKYPTKTKMIRVSPDPNNGTFFITCPHCAWKGDMDIKQLNSKMVRCGGTLPQHATFEQIHHMIKSGQVTYSEGCLRGIAFLEEEGEYYAHAADLNDFIFTPLP